MKIRRKTITAGLLVMIVEYTPPRYGDPPKARAAKRAATTAAQKRINDKSAKRKLEFKLAANFLPGTDYFITVTYDGPEPESRAAAVKDRNQYIRKVRDIRRKRGQELKWISATENKHGAGRWHHHIVINAADPAIDADELCSLWPHGHVKVTKLFDFKHRENTWADLAAYLTKERPETGKDLTPVGSQVYSCSRNLVNPLTDRRFIRSEWVDGSAPLTIPPDARKVETEETETEYSRYKYVKYLTAPLFKRE